MKSVYQTVSKFLFVGLFFISGPLLAQSKLFLSTGGHFTFGGNFTTSLAINGGWTADLEWDKKVMGSLHVVTGVSYFTAGYKSTDNAFGSKSSQFDARFVGVPVLARWNIGNRNFLNIDMGFVTYYLASAHLNESIVKFGALQDYQGNIAPYSNRVYVGFKVQFGVSLNRFMICDYFIYQFKGQETINGLADHWPLNAQQSTYLISNGYSDLRIVGIKVSYRLR